MKAKFSCLLLSTLFLASLAACNNDKVNANDVELKANPVKFAVYGDMPYGAVNPESNLSDIVLLSDYIFPALKRRSDIPFVVHLGDIGRPRISSCNPEFVKETKDSWQQGFNKPVYYTPGDNDWTDCGREGTKPQTDPLIALKNLRAIMYANQTESERKQQMTQIKQGKPASFGQLAYPENKIWNQGDVLFASVHMVGSDNGYVAGNQARIEEVKQRVEHDNKWLDKAEKIATTSHYQALVVIIHVDPFGEPKNDKDTRSFIQRCMDSEFYAGFCQKIENLALELNKPVLLVHGDTYAHCLDQPFPEAKNLWRLNAAGDYRVLDADVVTIDTANTKQPFSSVGILSGKAIPKACNYF